MTDDQKSAAVDTPIWLRPWFQFLLGATALFIFLSFVIPPIAELVYAVRAVLTPVVFALVLAYIFNPLVTFMSSATSWRSWAPVRTTFAKRLSKGNVSKNAP